jgi:hypothetical protein
LIFEKIDTRILDENRRVDRTINFNHYLSHDGKQQPEAATEI